MSSPSVPVCTETSSPSASTLETLYPKIGEDVIGIAECDQAGPKPEAIGLEKKEKVLIVQACDARDCETGTATFLQQRIEFIPQVIGTRPIYDPIPKDVCSTYSARPMIVIQLA